MFWKYYTFIFGKIFSFKTNLSINTSWFQTFVTEVCIANTESKTLKTKQINSTINAIWINEHIYLSLKGIDCKRNVKQYTIQRWQCNILIDIVEAMDAFLILVEMRKSHNRNTQFANHKHSFLIHTWSDKEFKGTNVNWTKPSLHGGQLKPRLESLLMKVWYN